jgi:hypothetical protein
MQLPLLSLVAALGLMGLGPLAPEKVTTAQKKIFEGSQMDSQAERLCRPDQGCVIVAAQLRAWTNRTSYNNGAGMPSAHVSQLPGLRVRS